MSASGTPNAVQWLAQDSEQPLLPEATRDWCARAAQLALETLPALSAQDPAALRMAAIDASQAAGLYGLTQPAAFGGQEADQLTLCAVRDTLAAARPPVLEALLGPGPGVLAGATGLLAERYLQPLLRGDKRAGFGITEPDDAPFYTRAQLRQDQLIISGQKSYVTGGASVDFVNTLVRVDGAPVLVPIDVTAPGVTRERVFETIDGSAHAAFRFDAVEVPAALMIGQPGDGLPRAMGQIGDTRLAIAATCVGQMRWVYGYLTEHLQSRTTAGDLRGDPLSVRLRLGELYTIAYGARSMLYRTARAAARGERVINESMACKIAATEGLTRIIDTAIQLVGGKAVVSDHPLAQLYRQVRSLRLAEGATDVLYQNIARGRLELGKGSI
ncbi:MAG: acyl-CoA dehydrogenase family protein [Pseudomonadota bacterium]